VVVVNGAITAELRRQWGLVKERAASHTHHAQDALVIAAATESMVKQITNYKKYAARHHHLEVPKPWESFREDVITAVEAVFISRMPRRKMSGEIHGPNPKSYRKSKEGKFYTVERKSLADVTLKNLENLVDRERNKILYNTIKNRLEEFDGDSRKAFSNPLFMPTKDISKQGPLIQHVHLITKAQSGVNVREGLAPNGKQVRLDIFEKNSKFYMSVVFSKNVYARELPTKIVKKGSELDWPSVSDNYIFKFSLYPNDFVRITKSSGEVIEGYYRTADISNAQIYILKHDETNSDNTKNYGIQSLAKFEKCVVNYFGQVSLVKQEKRLELANPSRRKKRTAQPQAGSASLSE
jgi:CRISPR-associated endonuclease Csn1